MRASSWSACATTGASVVVVHARRGSRRSPWSRTRPAPADGYARPRRARGRRRRDACVERPDADRRPRQRVAAADLVVPSPGVHPDHPALVAAHAAGVPVRSEIDLAPPAASAARRAALDRGHRHQRQDDGHDADRRDARARRASRASRPATSAVRCSTPPATTSTWSSPRSRRSSSRSRPTAFAPRRRGAAQRRRRPPRLARLVRRVRAAKAELFAHQGADERARRQPRRPGRARARRRRARHGSCGSAPGARRPATTACVGADLVGPRRTSLAAVPASGAPHDLANALAAAAAALRRRCRPRRRRARARRLRAASHHRVQLVGERCGVRFYDDSKATNPHATAERARRLRARRAASPAGATRASISAGCAPTRRRLRAVVAIGEAAGEVEAAFAGAVPVVRADSMHDAVRAAAELAQPGDAVLLSPACASFDWYESYAARGDDFAREVASLIDEPEGCRPELVPATEGQHDCVHQPAARHGATRGRGRDRDQATRSAVVDRAAPGRHGRGAQRRRRRDGAVGVVGGVARPTTARRGTSSTVS